MSMNMSKWLISLCFAILTLSQTPPNWGSNPVYTVRVAMLYDKPVTRWNFTYYYDWNKKVERYQHDSPQMDQMCVLPHTSFVKDKLPCHVTFATDGWSYISFPTQNFCCKCTNKFGSVRYDWLKQGATYKGIQVINGVSCTHWTKQGIELNHYYSTVDKQLPVKFFELKKGIPKSWDFDLTTYNTGPIDPDKFKPQCTDKCGGYCSIFGEEQLTTE